MDAGGDSPIIITDYDKQTESIIGPNLKMRSESYEHFSRDYEKKHQN